MTKSRNEVGPRSTRPMRTVAACSVAVFALTVALLPTPVASARGTKSKSVVVVQVVTRAPFGQMLATTSGLALYTAPGPCTGSCLTIWPPLRMPKGKKIPTGASGLGTAKVQVNHLHYKQVTYKGKLLYTFYADFGSAVTGQGVDGFVVATVP